MCARPLKRRMTLFNLVAVLACTSALLFAAEAADPAAGREIIVTNDVAFEPGSIIKAHIIARSSHVRIHGNGALLLGPGTTGDAKSLEQAGVGVLIEGAEDVRVEQLNVHGFATGLLVRDARAISVLDCDYSDNYHNPAHGWGDLPARGGIIGERVRESTFRRNRASRVWDGLNLTDSDANLVADNDFSHCSNTAAKLWHSSRNQFLNNNLSYGIRIDRAAGEVHARDSTGVLIETGSNDNYWFGNDVTHGGDGIFIRPLNRWVSQGNVFVENDTSYANNNCVESWSPGNTFIRNKANFGSYGFWLGGSDHTVLIGNEAAFNGHTNHNAPEPGFHHGGIVIVGGPSSHTLISGNDLHDNNGAGMAFRGDVGSRGEKWRTEHWVVQQNRIANNRVGIWGRWGEAILLAQNIFSNNEQDRSLTNVTDLIQLENGAAHSRAPRAVLAGPSLAQVGDPIRFDASGSSDPSGLPLRFHWFLAGAAGTEASLTRTFDQPGFYRLGLTVENGAAADLAWRDLLVVRPGAQEIGTENEAKAWGFELENNDGKGIIQFSDDPDALVGKRSLRFTPNPYPGAYATAIYPRTRDADWNLTGKKVIRFWIKAENPNLPGFQNAGPVLRLYGQNGQVELRPPKDVNLLNDPPWSEGRWLWTPLEIPLEGSAHWERAIQGQAPLEHVTAISISVDSWGGDPFTIWLDGLTIE